MKIKMFVGIIFYASLSMTLAITSFAESKIEVTNSVGATYKLTEKEGMERLRELAAEGCNEDGWYFIPEKELWVDNGTNIRCNQHDFDKSILPKYMEGVKEAIVYSIHIHPAHTYRAKKIRGYYPPPFDDLCSFLDEMKYFESMGIKVSEARVVNWGGYWSVNLGISDLEQLESKYSREYFYKEYRKLVKAYREAYEEMYFTHRDKESFKSAEKKVIEDFEKGVSHLGVDLKYYYLSEKFFLL